MKFHETDKYQKGLKGEDAVQRCLLRDGYSLVSTRDFATAHPRREEDVPMITIVARCRACGMEFEPDHDAIVRGAWRVCAGCRLKDAPEPQQPASRCEQCGRPLRAGTRTICLGCLIGGPAL